MARQDNIEKLLQIHEDRLQKRKEQNAKLGVNTPPEVLTEIESIETMIEVLQAELARTKNVTYPPYTAPSLQTSFFLSRNELRNQIPVAKFISDSGNLFVGGVALQYFVRTHVNLLNEQLKRGVTLKFLLLDPKSPDLDSVTKMFNRSFPTTIRRDIDSTLDEIYDQLRSTAKPPSPGSVEVHLTHFVPPFSFAISKSKGILTAGIRAYGCNSAERPYFFLKQSDDEEWFDILVKSCENLWEDSPAVSQKAGVVAYQSTDKGGVEVLLVTARKKPGEIKEKWIFPVGDVDPGESLGETAIRECFEESGYNVAIGSPLETIYIESDKKSINRMTFFIAEVINGTENYEDKRFRQRKFVQTSELIQNIAEDFLPIARAALAKLAS